MTIIKLKFFILFYFLFCITVSSVFASHPPVHHELTVTLDPSQSIAKFNDVITIPKSILESITSFRLNKSSEIERIELSGNKISIVNSSERFLKFDLPQSLKEGLAGPLKLVCIYTLPLPISDNTMETLFISGSDYFYPQPEMKDKKTYRVTFKVKIQTPISLKVVSQGEKLEEIVENGNRTVIWKEEKPQEEILLIADRYHEFSKRHGSITLYAYLRNDDNALAERYFKATESYIYLYSKILAPYPYKKFALVENSQQTGYGMPSFTLLGSRVIRFPFILHTSYPHEILHNWFGNGVYIDADSGNWAEGLTSYLSDHILPEQKGKGDRYRFQELMKYENYVNEMNDFPLAEFKGRDNMASQAVGYGKTLMVLHMLRLEVGDTLFLQALRDFYKQNQFHYAGFKELRISFERTSKRDLKKFFNQWTLRKGGPQLRLSSASKSKQNGQHLLKLEIRQTQFDPAFKLKLPIAVWLKDQEEPWLGSINIVKKKQTSFLPFSAEPLKVLLDPYHEVFRRLNPEEAPPSIGKTYGSETQIPILPENESLSDLLNSYQQFALSLKTASHSSDIILKEDTLIPVPAGSLWVFGQSNIFARQLKGQLDRYDVKIDEQGVTLDNKNFQWKNHSFVLTLNRYGSKDNTVTWIIASSGKSIPGLIRKLPHYGKYGYLVFKGDIPDNVAKGTWPSSGAGLYHTFKKGFYSLPSKISLIKKKS